MEMLEPVVKVIAVPQFLGVPEELWDEDGLGEFNTHDIRKIHATQDQGSEWARLIECAGRTCYDSYGKGRGSEPYHHHIKEVGHGSVTAHGMISFYLDNLSRGCTHELVRHAIGVGISQRSTRYVDESESPWIWHPLIGKVLSVQDDSGLVDELVDLMEHSRRVYRRLVEECQGYLLAHTAVGKIDARKQARGAARGALGNALCTGMVWSVNVRALRYILAQRAATSADAEIRVLFNRIYEAALPYIPEYLNDFERVECPDGIGYGLRTDYHKI